MAVGAFCGGVNGQPICVGRLLRQTTLTSHQLRKRSFCNFWPGQPPKQPGQSVHFVLGLRQRCRAYHRTRLIYRVPPA
uniref:Uncharacterized protein n=1 Tax=Leuconostoc citreum TaxID=33964 RepID=A0A098DLQ5_LEUCI|nr:Protein of unknown function [Leuconostoc citreum]